MFLTAAPGCFSGMCHLNNSNNTESLRKKSDRCIPSFLSTSDTHTHTHIHNLLYMSNTFCLTRLVHVLRLRVTVCCVADRGFVGVGGQLMIQLLWAVDENGQTLHLVTGTSDVGNIYTSKIKRHRLQE